MLLVAIIFYFRDPLYQNLSISYKNLRAWLTPPCQAPIRYSLGDFDKRFNLSNEEALKVVAQAANIWSQSIGRELFKYDSRGDLKINFIYDTRQEATDKLKKLGIELGGDKSSYDTLKSKYDSLRLVYLQQKSDIAMAQAEFQKFQAAYEAEVKMWNKRDGAPPEVYARLQKDKAQLEKMISDINDKIAIFNDLAETLNAEATVLNKFISNFNLGVAKYNTVGGQLPGEFDEGLYIRDVAGTRINIYQFDSKEKLIRLLAHELGHALGLDHTSDPNDIMYRLNQSNNIQVTSNDSLALKTACHIK